MDKECTQKQPNGPSRRGKLYGQKRPLKAKEIWEIPEGRVPDGFVLHSTGWPQAPGESGGSFIYKMAGNRLAVGYPRPAPPPAEGYPPS